jgi:fatty acid desaturase
MTNAGWLGHDYVHGVDDFSIKMRNFAAVAAGLDPIWWSDKHNKHHALTNEMGVDEDIATDPFLYQWPPAPENDSPLRKIQHLIFYIPFSFLFALWRVDSLKVVIDAIEQKRPNAKSELYSLLIHYAVLLTLFPVHVWVPAVFMSGLVSALIVTPTHQSEELFEDHPSDWVTAQFRSTRNAVMTNPFSEWLWGGMQYQLEHHLFPSMPRAKYPLLRERMMEFAAANNIPGGYRESGEWEILKMNWELYKRVAEADAVPGSPPTKGHVGQVGAIRDTASPAAAATATAARKKTSSKVSTKTGVSAVASVTVPDLSAGAPATMTSVISNSDFE